MCTMPGRTHGFVLLCVFGMLLFFVPSANADATYTYTGGSFTNCNVQQQITSFSSTGVETQTTYDDTACPAGAGITGTITLAQPLPANAVGYSLQGVVSVNFEMAAYSVNFPDETTSTQFYTSTFPGLLGGGWQFSTDAAGNITGWSTGGFTYNEYQYGSNSGLQSNDFVGDLFAAGPCHVSVSECFVFSNSTPGQWSMSMTPEPSARALFLVGLALLLVCATKRRIVSA